MKAIAIIAAIVAVTATATAHARDGSQMRKSTNVTKTCWVNTDGRGYVRSDACDSIWVETQRTPPKYTYPTANANIGDGDGGGGGGGGGGANR